MPSETFEVDDYAFIGRTFDEYARMFDLDPGTLAGETILDCPSGPDSFVATAAERGATVVGADVAYAKPPDALAARCAADVAAVSAQHAEKTDLFAWEFYDGVADRRRYLERARERFLADYPAGRGRYVAAALPDLPFADDAFSLVLSAHLLFLYDDRLDHAFHLAALRELARVAGREVRAFPLVGLDTERYARLDDVVAALEGDGLSVEVRDVPFEFQQGATEMLVVAV